MRDDSQMQALVADPVGRLEPQTLIFGWLKRVGWARWRVGWARRAKSDHLRV